MHQLEDIGYQIGGERTKPSVATVNPSTDAEFQQYLQSLPYPESFLLLTFIDGHALQDSSLSFAGKTNHVVSLLAPGIQNRIYFKNTWNAGEFISGNLSMTRFREISHTVK